MSGSAVSRNYAGTLFDLASRDGSESRFGDLIAKIGEMYDTDPVFSRFLNAPSVALGDKKAALRAALAGAPDLFVRFLMVVLDRRRQSALPAIADGYRELLDSQAGQIRATVTLPYEADDALASVIVEALEVQFGQKMIPEFRTDDRILGGMVVRAGDRLLDASVRQQLEDLKRELN